MRRPSRAAPRALVALWAVTLLAVLAGIIWLSESLRHPHPVEGLELEELEDTGGDPRDPVECPEPPPREDTPDEPRIGPVATAPIEVTTNDLYDCPAFYDRRTVRFRGEVVGAVMRRTAGAWTQLNDDLYADVGPLPSHREFRGANAGVGVLLPAERAHEIAVVGGPRTQGDIVEVVGTFHRIDPATREVAVIRAAEMSIVRRGSAVAVPLLVDRLVAAFLLVSLAGGAVTLQALARRRGWSRLPG